MINQIQPHPFEPCYLPADCNPDECHYTDCNLPASAPIHQPRPIPYACPMCKVEIAEAEMGLAHVCGYQQPDQSRALPLDSKLESTFVELSNMHSNAQVLLSASQADNVTFDVDLWVNDAGRRISHLDPAKLCESLAAASRLIARLTRGTAIVFPHDDSSGSIECRACEGIGDNKEWHEPDCPWLLFVNAHAALAPLSHHEDTKDTKEGKNVD